MPKKTTINLGELQRLIAEGPAGQEKIEKQERAIRELSQSLMLTMKQVRPYEVPIRSEANTIKFGIIGDTQIGSLYQRTDALKAFYEYCVCEDINTVLHAGDVIDGWKVYKGQEFELAPNGRSWPEQRDMFSESIPRIDGMTTIFITGNHDHSFKKLVGMEVGDELQRIRPDWKYIGADIGTVVLKANNGLKFSVMLIHPGGGINQYALSYRPQRIIENLPGGQKPNLIAIGHFHKAFWLPEYRNVTAFCVGCFQSQTPFMKQQSIAAHIGGWIVTVTLAEPKKLTSRVQAEFIGFYEEQGK